MADERKIVAWYTRGGKHIPIYEDESISRDNDKKEKEIGVNESEASKMNKKSPDVIYRDGHIGYKDAINQQFRDGKITKEKRDEVLGKINNEIQKVLDVFVDNFTDDTLKSLFSTMNRQFSLTGGSDITGAIELYKTPNGFVLNAPATRSNFRAFMDNDGNVRRMPANEMKSAQKIKLSGRHANNLDDRFRELSRKYNK